MCDVMPTISEDSISQRSSQFGDDANFEQLMVSMLDERDKLVDSLKNEQEKTGDLEGKVKDLEKERDSLQRQLNQNLPQVNIDTRSTSFSNSSHSPGVCLTEQGAQSGQGVDTGEGRGDLRAEGREEQH